MDHFIKKKIKYVVQKYINIFEFKNVFKYICRTGVRSGSEQIRNFSERSESDAELGVMDLQRCNSVCYFSFLSSVLSIFHHNSFDVSPNVLGKIKNEERGS
jgi:hypothetical protein